MPNATILVVDDEPLIRWSLVERLRTDGLRRASRRRPARRRSSASPTASTSCCSTTSCPTSTASPCCAQIKEHDPDILVILLTAYATVDTAVEAMKIGAYHFANKPFNLDDISAMVEQRARDDAAAPRSAACCAPARRSPTRPNASSASRRRWRALRDLLRKVAASPASTVLLTGESGTGKDLAAKVLHYNSDRAQPAVREHHLLGAFPRRCSRASCSATSAARSPTRASRSAACSRRPTAAPCSSTRSARWCRRCRPSCCAFLEEKAFKRVGGPHDVRVDVRVDRRHQPRPRGAGQGRALPRPTCTTGSTCCRSSCRRCARTSRTCRRWSTFYVDQFNREFRKSVRGASPAALRELRAYGWPGNIREVRNAVERAMLLADGAWLEPQDFPALRHGAGGARRSRCRRRASISRSSSAAWSCRRSSAAVATRRGRRPCSASTATRSATASRSSASPRPFTRASARRRCAAPDAPGPPRSP